ncbi:MAG TPA: hypothetical protein VLY46_00915 [Usitatibacter sp.]|nr:hypothetical protein [Usitatibacter sp.]
MPLDPERTDIRMWGAIIERGPQRFSIIVTGVATNSETTVGVTDFRRDMAASLEDAEYRRDALLRSVEADVAARGDRVVSFERVLWDLPGLR